MDGGSDSSPRVLQESPNMPFGVSRVSGSMVWIYWPLLVGDGTICGIPCAPPSLRQVGSASGMGASESFFRRLSRHGVKH